MIYGDAGYRSRYLPHAKRALYHLSYTPTMSGYISYYYQYANQTWIKIELHILKR